MIENYQEQSQNTQIDAKYRVDGAFRPFTARSMSGAPKPNCSCLVVEQCIPVLFVPTLTETILCKENVY